MLGTDVGIREQVRFMISCTNEAISRWLAFLASRTYGP